MATEFILYPYSFPSAVSSSSFLPRNRNSLSTINAYSDPELSFVIQTSLIKKIRNLEKLVSLHVVLDSKERIAKYLCDHTEDFFNTKNIIVAEILNISPETLSRILRVFKNEELIDSKAKTINKEKLESFFI